MVGIRASGSLDRIVGVYGRASPAAGHADLLCAATVAAKLTEGMLNYGGSLVEKGS